MASATVAAGPRYAPEDPTLPKPWRGLVDGKTGYLYFWNPETNITQYERPGGNTNSGSAPQQRSSSANISSSVQVQQSSQGQYRDNSYNDNDDRYNKGSNGGSKFASETRNYEIKSTNDNNKGGDDYYNQVKERAANLATKEALHSSAIVARMGEKSLASLKPQMTSKIEKSNKMAECKSWTEYVRKQYLQPVKTRLLFHRKKKCYVKKLVIRKSGETTVEFK